jgi:hypothetical protein
MSPDAPIQPAVGIDEEVKLTVGDVEYVLIGHQNFVKFDGNPSTPKLFLVYLTKPGQIISQSTLRSFRTQVLDHDDVFQPIFCSNVIFYGSKEKDVQVESDTTKELAVWNAKSWTFVEGDSVSKVAPGPYVFVKGQVWQPWRVYCDFNATFMCTFKPASNNPSG